MAVHQVDHGAEGLGAAGEQLLDRGIGRLCAGWRQQGRVAVRDEPAARPEAEHRRQAERQTPPPPPEAEGAAHGAERQTFMGHDHARQAVGGDPGAHDRGLARDVVHEGVEMAGIVMEDDERADVRRLGDTHALLPGRMAPALVSGIFGVGVARIINHDVGAAAQIDDGLVAAAFVVLGVGDVADRLAAMLDAIAGGAVGMVQRRGAHRDRLAAGQVVARLELREADRGLEDVERHRIDRRLHQVADDLLQRVGRLEMARPQPHRIALVEQRRKESETRQVIEMGVGEIDVDVERRLARELDAERTDAGAGVENQPPATSRDFEARCVAAVAHVFGTSAGNRTANAPKTDFQTISQTDFPKPSAPESTGRWLASTDGRATRFGHDLA